MLWALQAAEIKPIKSIILHLRFDHDMLTSGHVGGHWKGHPFMRSRIYHMHPRKNGIIYWVIEPSSIQFLIV